ncbi:biopolymer transporter ExbD [Calothrix sp. UHCC 0171]|uniref:ExbD/TolR family protein n=1 Tax=Calothrix sp. UHCC 0171 TaxID=3110245 RepID=UPI002B1F14F4|nr:biopolymer transporter ExbD [Calothrix sp. UHCC 0171]MEA5570662.1 biopolymer transporter ExbD [Calothrix sp. UHCC 0171]
MKIKSTTPTDDVQVQIVPLIDVIFCILTFFILVTLQFSRQEVIKVINFDLPKSNTGTAIPGASNLPGSPAEPQRLVLHLDGLGQIRDTNQPGQPVITKEQLPAFLENYVKQNPDKPLILNASRSAQYNDVIETLTLLQQVGGSRASLGVADSSSSLQPTNPGFPSFPGTVPQENNPQLTPVNPQGGTIPNLPPTTNQIPEPEKPAATTVPPQQ